MKKTIDKNEFIEEMQAYDDDAFSYEGLCCLFDYLEDYEQSIGEELEFDVLALHWKYSEMSVNEFLDSYYWYIIIEEIISKYQLESKYKITADVLYEYENIYMYGRIIAIVNDNTIIVDTER